MTKLLQNRRAGFWLGPFQIVVQIGFLFFMRLAESRQKHTASCHSFSCFSDTSGTKIGHCSTFQGSVTSRFAPRLEESGFDGAASKIVGDSYTGIENKLPLTRGAFALGPMSSALSAVTSWYLWMDTTREVAR